MTPDEIRMRAPAVQCAEEFQIYAEIAPLVFAELEALEAGLIIAEGAAFTPEVMQRRSCEDYICMDPEPDFQIEHYRQRPWVPYVLAGCRDQKSAFDNWMQRDIRYARQVRQMSEALGVPCLVNDGSMTEEEMYAQVRALLRL